MMLKMRCIICILSLSFFLTGCGLIAIPYRTSFPEASFATIKIVDAETGEPIENGQVAYSLAKFTNFVPPSNYAKCSLTDLAPRKVPTAKEEAKSYWGGEETAQGTFQLLRKKRWSWYQFTFPIGFPVGAGIYHTYDGLLLVSAPGYRTMVISDSFGRLHRKHTPEQWQTVGKKVRDMTKSHATINRDETDVALIKKINPLPQR